MNSDSIDIRFDEDGKIRVLSSETYDHYCCMAKECDGFISSAEKFKQKSEVVMKRLHDVLDDVAKEKTTTISIRNEVENETQKRKQQMNNLQMLLHEKDKELNSIHRRHDSMVSVLSKQENEMEKIRGF